MVHSDRKKIDTKLVGIYEGYGVDKTCGLRQSV